MPSIFHAFSLALRDLARPRILGVLFLPMIGAIVLWSVLGWMFWDDWTAAIANWLSGSSIARWLTERGAPWIVESLSIVTAIALLLPALLITAVLITELVAMPVIVSVVARAHPALVRKAEGSVVGSMGNAISAIVVFALLWLATLPLWLTGIGAVILPALNSAYLNQRLFRYDALSEHASREEFTIIARRAKGRLYGLGLLLAFLYYVPFLNLIVPVLSGLAFTHLCLAELARLREDRREGGGMSAEG